MSSSRRTRAAAKGKGETPPAKQLTGYAFNIFGWVVKLPEEIDGDAVVILNAYEISTTPWEKAVNTILNKGETPWRESISLTPRELDDNGEAGVHRYLLVGLTYPALDDEYFKKHPLQTKQSPVGTKLDLSAVIEKEATPLMVVTPIQEMEMPNITLYTLLNPKQGLCTPYHVGQKACFYFPLFRDGCTDLKKRGPGWNRIVARQALRPSEKTLSEKQQIYKRARNTTKVVIDPTLSLQNEVSALVECFDKSGELWHLEELSRVLEQADEDLIYMPPATNTNMRMFVDNEEEFDIHAATGMVEELSTVWPDLAEIDSTDVLLLKEQLVRDDIFIEYYLLRPFIVQGCSQIRKLRASNDNDGLLGVAREAAAIVGQVLGSSKSAPSILSPNEENSVILALNATLKNIIKAGKTFDQKLRDSCGDHTMKGSLHDVWEKFAAALDMDSAKLSWFEASRYSTTNRMHKDKGLVEMLEYLTGVIDEMHLEG